MNDLQKARSIILNNNLPITTRIRALFYLKNIPTLESANILCEALTQKLNEHIKTNDLNNSNNIINNMNNINDRFIPSVLLKHEAAYVLGQMRIPETVPILKDVLADKSEDEIARHEAGEALGNFLDPSVVEYLKCYIEDENINVKETCILAVKKYEDFISKNLIEKETVNFLNEIDNSNSSNIACSNKNISSNYVYDILSPFDSYDPAYPLENTTIQEAKQIYLDQSACIYKRYSAMFFLRNTGTSECIKILGEGFNDKSSLFKHEIAFVFGQMRKKESVIYLSNVLINLDEHGMVRHECAEALGAIGSEDALDALKPFVEDCVDVVRKSVEVALDIYNYENSNEPEYVRI